MTDIIAKKRDKKELTKAEIEFFIDGVTNATIPDYQISALLMAIVLNGMTEEETLHLTKCMAQSGDMLDLSILGDKTVDKHSTGGVGDKTTLVIAPIVASLGCTVAKMSGRGLGHTGGTVDKFEAIDGYKTAISKEKFLNISKTFGMCVVGQSGNFAPADKKLYALRDVTSTVESIPLIASSIMSKKLAAGAKNIVLDVKYGSGAFMKTKQAAEKLANAMVKIGKGAGRNVCALITNMNAPLGTAVGNNLEVKEALEILNGKGDPTLLELCCQLAANMYKLCSNNQIDHCLNEVDRVIKSGCAFKKLCDVVKAQGGNAKLLTGENEFPKAEASLEIKAQKDGYIIEIDCYNIGKTACICGAGRETLTDVLDFSAGVKLHKKIGDFVKCGDTLATLYGKTEKITSAEELCLKSIKIGDHRPQAEAIIYKIIS